MKVPKYDEMFNALIEALKTLGGSGNVNEIEEETAKVLSLTDEQLNEIHRGNRTKFSYRLAWTRNYLKRYGVLENSSRGVWTLTKKGFNAKKVDKHQINTFVKELDLNVEVEDTDQIKTKPEDNIQDWQDKLLHFLKEMDPGKFEMLCQRILREAGFVEVKVIGRTGDGGIDGRGIYRLGGLISFRVIFQCKRYKGSVGSREIREFKGTMAGRADKGLFITTGTFTRDAKEEAFRDGSIPIDLIDGIQLADKMKELGLGIKIKTEEIVDVDIEWFENFS